MATTNESPEREEVASYAGILSQDKGEDDHKTEQPDFKFDEKTTHHPAFFLVDVPDEANAAAALDVLPLPFLDSTVDQVYEFFKNHLRPADDDSRGAFHTFTYFTFLVVDAECLKSNPWQCILCCDTPDYGEGPEEVKLKQLRVPIAKAMAGLTILEMLIQTPSEYAAPRPFVLAMVPPAWEVEIHNEQGERTGQRETASPGRARRKKRQSVWNVEETARQQQAEAASAERGEL